jgi:hypothetical protein
MTVSKTLAGVALTTPTAMSVGESSPRIYYIHEQVMYMKPWSNSSVS